MAQKPEVQPAPSTDTVRHLEFDKDVAFQTELRRRVDDFFRRTGRRKRDCWQMYLKTVIILALFVTTYLLLVFVAQSIWPGVFLAALLGFATALVGFNVQHDGGHQSYSSRRWVNRLMAMNLDLIGGSSFVWHWKHTIIHHMYVNVTGYDNDINLGLLGRLSPHEPRLWFHRWQHLYLWPLYGFEAMKLQLLDDFKYVIIGRLGPHRIPRPRRWELVIFILGKVVFFSWMFLLPLLFHPLLVVIFYYFIAVLVLGVTLTVVFLMPHCVEDADFPLPLPGTCRLADPWAVHQARVTVDFARRNPLLRWLLGGLNYHKEHHLFPLICHVNYPALSPIVEQTCREFGLKYKEHRSFPAGIASHYRWLKKLGRAD